MVNSGSGSQHGFPAELPGQARTRLKILFAYLEVFVQNLYRVERWGDDV